MKSYVTCVAERKGGKWEVICLDFDIAIQGDSFEEVTKEMDIALNDFLEYVLTLPKEEARMLLRRRAPLSLRLYYSFRFALMALMQKNDNDTSFIPFAPSVAMP